MYSKTNLQQTLVIYSLRNYEMNIHFVKKRTSQKMTGSTYSSIFFFWGTYNAYIEKRLITRTSHGGFIFVEAVTGKAISFLIIAFVKLSKSEILAEHYRSNSSNFCRVQFQSSIRNK